ncbi:MAG: hypothetical protein U5J97_07540 [Trueperaceae bacterium]|nr:hypothetical protein [Trueperaceae bacterium]
MKRSSIGQRRLRLDREQRLVRPGVLAPDVVTVVRRHQPQAVPLGQTLQDRVQPLLLLQPVVLQLDEEVVAEDVQVLPQDLLAGLLADVENGSRNLRAQAS